MTFHHKIRNIILNFSIIREIAFFFFGKKVYKNRIDKKIKKLMCGKYVLTSKRIDNLIVSLTSFPERIDEIKYTIYSLLDQTVLPEKIILWLAESQFPVKENDLPSNVLDFRNYNFEIHWCEDIKSYKKLVPSLIQYPDYFILTVDDDIYYDKRLIQKIWQEHLEHPNEYVCHLANKIKFDKEGNVLPYLKWQFGIKSSASSYLHFPLCGGGGLYHKSYLYSDIIKKELFLELAPYADDIWFYFMLIKGDTTIRVVKNPCNKIKYVNPYRE
jgi:GTPase SAR1 family protein